MTAPTRLDPAPVNVRVTLSALWTSMLFVFIYVDHFSLYRPDVRAKIEAGEISGLTINGSFLLATTVYVALPSLMVAATLMLRPRASRTANLVLAPLYALTVIGGAIGEWGYYVLGSTIQVALLAAITHQAWTWPREVAATATATATADVDATALPATP